MLMKQWRQILTVFLAGVLLGPAPVVHAQEAEESLVHISLDIFPKLVAVDLDLQSKLTPDNKIHLQVFYDQNKEQGDSVARQLREKYPRIADYPVQVTAHSEFYSDAPTAILLVERLKSDHLKKVTEYGVANHILVFSPFKEDVDRGIAAGMYMAIRIHPYFNRATLNRSGIRLHQIILKSAKFYE
ncbi:MAG: hypothetical protein GWO19_12230 [Nitrospinaceae bacterium]|nr:hypothetical protein [Nitrospinaceae bacterium]NIS85672.1 hypothetical protein [Nitrospinaceae bacterium]NIU44722.1 hypothetical protein [Nitrospinaceae bacterium]NIU96889.1 hypothetical protein [Nitrospinaceae bacterium]NIW59474.1 hypothetical protein [Nitrospinaceae bacterium]